MGKRRFESLEALSQWLHMQNENDRLKYDADRIEDTASWLVVDPCQWGGLVLNEVYRRHGETDSSAVIVPTVQVQEWVDRLTSVHEALFLTFKRVAGLEQLVDNLL